MNTENDAPDNVVPENELAKRRFVHETTERIAGAVSYLSAAYAALQDAGVPARDWVPLVADHLPDLPDAFRAKLRSGGTSLYLEALIDGVIGFAKNGYPGFIEAAFPRITQAMGPQFATLFKMGADVGNGAGSMVAKAIAARRASDESRAAAAAAMADDDADDLDDDEFERAQPDDTITAARMRITIRRLFQDAPRMTNPDGSPDQSQAPALPCTLVLRGSIPPIEGVLSTTPEGGLKFLTPVETEDKEAPQPQHPRAPRPTKMVLCEQFFDYSDVIAVMLTRDIKATAGSGLIS